MLSLSELNRVIDREYLLYFFILCCGQTKNWEVGKLAVNKQPLITKHYFVTTRVLFSALVSTGTPFGHHQYTRIGGRSSVDSQPDVEIFYGVSINHIISAL
jgi:hypothetical protein